jgi:hypothetical protein
MSETTYEMNKWVFRRGDQKYTVRSIYPMTEAQARAAAAEKGKDLIGFIGVRNPEEVVLSEPLPPKPDGVTMHNWTVRLSKVTYAEVEVEALTEDEAKKAAIQEADSCDFVDADGIVVEGITDHGLVEVGP